MQYSKGETIERRVRTIDRLARWASTAIRCWELIEASESTDLLDPYSPYLLVSAHGHRELGLLYLNAIFERRKDTVNVGAICAHLRTHGVDVSSIMADVNDHQNALKKLYAIRSSAIGHRTSVQSYDETFAKVKMTRDELNSLLALAARCSSDLSKAINLEPDGPIADPVDYLNKMLIAVAEAEQNRQSINPWN